VRQHRRQDSSRHPRRVLYRAGVTTEADPLLLAAGLSADQLAELLGLVTATDITELDITLDATRMSLRRPASAPVAASSQAAPLLAFPALDARLRGWRARPPHLRGPRSRSSAKGRLAAR